MPESSISSWRAFSPLNIQLRPARYLRGSLLAVHLLAGSALWVSDLPVFTRCVVLTLVALSLWSVWRELTAMDAIQGMVWAVDKKALSLIGPDRRPIVVDDILSSAVFPGLMVLKLLRSDRALPTWVILTPDRCDRTEWRRLRLAMQFAPPLQRDASGQG